MIPVHNYYHMWKARDYLVMYLSSPLVVGHYVVYAQQWRLFRKDVQRIAASVRGALLGVPPPKQA